MILHLSYIPSSLSCDPLYPLTLPSFSQFHFLTNLKSKPLHLLFPLKAPNDRWC
ncbi:hypothetical protein HanRHA438_Chr14g0636471 [Helianthus annuus]|nr:hypothetical protein HanHA89_Chr14g0544841 [Helianthus annuus]KAJ0655058.1 hypothetical protein HanLR1_Chr14g0514131 [Helianthus annuus]KAJ0658770.1 hypothetical protein HanOQP8_Chr14g0511961 [Helianthus annuus]KAJ0702434.1 hypothetical protein HanPI659440_Chr14g0529461 [Helianthus annuus]KAJ0852293.1 hypothetical protein HanRHA438_Chr14g0636471 [Helianthus annuus]